MIALTYFAHPLFLSLPPPPDTSSTYSPLLRAYTYINRDSEHDMGKPDKSKEVAAVEKLPDVPTDDDDGESMVYTGTICTFEPSPP